MPLIYEDQIELFEFQNSPGYNFYWSSKLSRSRHQDLMAKINLYNSEQQLDRKRITHQKVYPTSRAISLQPKGNYKNDHFSELLQMRRTRRKYSILPVQFSELSDFLQLGYSLQKTTSVDEDLVMPRRTTPSGGGRYPLELYIANFSTEGLEPGLYHYDINKFSLEQISTQDPSASFIKAFENPVPQQSNISFAVFITGIFKRTTAKYDSVGWKVMYLEAGCLLQNFYLAAEALQLGCSPYAGGWTDEINKFLNINEQQEISLMMMTVGKQD